MGAGGGWAGGPVGLLGSAPAKGLCGVSARGTAWDFRGFHQ